MVSVDSSAIVVSPGGSTTVTLIGNTRLPCSAILLSMKVISSQPSRSLAEINTSKEAGIRVSPSDKKI